MLKVTLTALGLLAQRVFLALDRIEHKIDVLIRLVQVKNEQQFVPLDQLAYDRSCPVCMRKVEYIPSEGPVSVTIRTCGCEGKPAQVTVEEGDQ